MAIKTTGAEFKRFYNDPKFWPGATSDSAADNIWHEDETVTVDGIVMGPEADLRAMADQAAVIIEDGIVFGPDWNDNEPSFELYFKRWRKSQSIRSFLVECDESKLDAVMAAIKAAGAKVVK